MSEEREFGFETRMVHAGHIPDSAVGARAVPIYQTTSYVFYDTDHAADLFDLKQYGHIYSRISNPTVSVLEERVASLEGATGAVAASSGMAAQLAIFMTLLEPGDEIVSSSHLYGGTTTQFTFTLQKMGVKVTFVHPHDFDAWEKAMGPRKMEHGRSSGGLHEAGMNTELISARSVHRLY
ncbi:MAG TPA: PLP-dependent transferase [Spirochaetia bacterium]|nr:PLP-dependent transferase [Spirochaetia bacterium]